MTKTMRRDTNPHRSNERPAYEAPKVIETAAFETLALECGQRPGDIGNLCYTNPGAS